MNVLKALLEGNLCIPELKGLAVNIEWHRKEIFSSNGLSSYITDYAIIEGQKVYHYNAAEAWLLGNFGLFERMCEK